MEKERKKGIKKILWGIVALSLLFIAYVIIWVNINKDLIFKKITSGFEKNLNTLIVINDFGFSILKSFPDVSLVLEGVTIYSAENFIEKYPEQEIDTLFWYSEVILDINIFNLLKKKYIINDIYLNHGTIHLAQSSDISNYEIWVSEKKPVDTASFALQINSININNTKLIYSNLSSKVLIEFHLNESELKGDFNDDGFHIKSDLKAVLTNTSINALQIFNNKYINISSEIIKKQDTLYISPGKLALNKLQFELDGWYNLKDNNTQLLVEAINNPFNQLISLMPEEIAGKIRKNKISGNVNAKLVVEGRFSDNLLPQIDMQFDVKQGQMVLENGIQIQKINIKGGMDNFRNKQLNQAILNLQSFSFETGPGHSLQGNLRLINFNRPYINLSVQGSLPNTILINTAPEFFKHNDKSLEQNGFSSLSLQFKGPVEFPFTLNEKQISMLDINGQIELNHISFMLSDVSETKPVYLKYGLFKIHDDIHFQNVSLYNQSNSLLLNGKIDNWPNAIRNKKLTVKGQVNSSFINLDEVIFFSFNQDDNNSDKPGNADSSFRFEKVILDLKMEVDSFYYRGFYASQLTGNMEYSPASISFTPLQFKSMQGSFYGGASLNSPIDANAQTRHLKLQGNLEHINVKEAFTIFKNFGQDFITYKHIDGYLTGSFSVTLNLHHETFEVLFPSIYANADITINEGELVKLEPMLAFSKYIEVDELMHIKFSTLRNQITIDRQVVEIPMMDIQSNAINLTCYGAHNFDNEFEYHMKISLSELLSGKAKKSRNRFKYRIEEDKDIGKSHIYLKIEGNPDDYKVKYDAGFALKSLKQNLKQEGQELRSLFNGSNKEEEESAIPSFEDRVNREGGVVFEDVPEEGKEENATTPSTTKEEKKNDGIRIQWEDE